MSSALSTAAHFSGGHGRCSTHCRRSSSTASSSARSSTRWLLLAFHQDWTIFALWLLCGLLPWNFFGLITSLGISAVSANSGLVRRVAFPRGAGLSNVLHACVQFSIEMALLLIVMLVAGSPFLPWLPLVVVTSVLLAVSHGDRSCAQCAGGLLPRNVSYLWAIVIQVWFFATPIVYPPELLEAQAPTWVYNLLQLNPMNGFVELYRRLLYDAGFPGWRTLAGLVVISAGSLVIGWAIFHRMSRRLPEEV